MTTVVEEKNTLEIIDHAEFKRRLFPMQDHALYGTLNSFDESPYLTPPVLADFTNDTDFSEEATSLEICPACFFNTSGTTSRSKKIPFSDADLERQKVHEAIALRKLGMGEGDAVMSLGAPMPSISGWAIVNGSEATGARALNTSQLDYDYIFDKNWGDQVTFVIGTPLVVKEIGKAIVDEYGPIRECMPNMRTGIIFGDVLPDALRAELKAIWGFDNVYSLYGTVEADVVATECPANQGEMDLMSERLIFEFVSEEELAKERTNSSYVPKMVPIADIADGAFGEIIISDLSRDTLPLIRYRIGDIVQVHRAAAIHNVEYPTISVLGRSKNTILFGDVAFYEMQLDNALKRCFGEDLIEWRITEQASDNNAHYLLEVQLVAGLTITNEKHDQLHQALVSQRKDLSRVAMANEISLIAVTEFEQVEVSGDTKAKRIILL